MKGLKALLTEENLVVVDFFMYLKTSGDFPGGG